MDITMFGVPEKTESSRFQVMLIDKSNKSVSPLNYPRTNRFFDDLEKRNAFINMLETAINSSGGKLYHKSNESHPLFESFNILDNRGNANYELVVYR